MKLSQISHQEINLMYLHRKELVFLFKKAKFGKKKK